MAAPAALSAGIAARQRRAWPASIADVHAARAPSARVKKTERRQSDMAESLARNLDLAMAWTRCPSISANLVLCWRRQADTDVLRRRASPAPAGSTVKASMRLPFFYGWLIVAVVFVSMGIGVNVRTAFSLLFPPILDEFGWERGVTAGAFSFGFVVSAVFSPLMGRLMDRRGPR